MLKFKNQNRLIILVVFIYMICLCRTQPSAYEDILSQTKQEKKQKQKNEEVNTETITPIVYGKWWCDSSLKLNSVREDVMTNDNYNM
jgi:hypothetical protein